MKLASANTPIPSEQKYLMGIKTQCNQVQLKKRAKDVQDALDDNNEQMKRLQHEKTKVGVLRDKTRGSASHPFHVPPSRAKGLPFFIERAGVTRL